MQGDAIFDCGLHSTSDSSGYETQIVNVWLFADEEKDSFDLRLSFFSSRRRMFSRSGQ